MNSRTRGLLEVNLAGLLFGGTAQFSKLIDMPVVGIVEWRSIVALVVLLLFAWWNKLSLRLENKTHAFIFVIIGSLLALHWVTYFTAMNISTIAIGITALFTYPVITVLLEPLFFNTRLDWKDAGLGLMVFVGVVTLMPSFELSGNVAQGVLLGVLSAFLFALRVLIQKKYVQHYPSSVSMAYQLAVTIVVLLCIWDVSPIQTSTHLWQILLLGTVFTSVPHTLIVNSLKSLQAKTMSIISCMQPIYAMVIAIFILTEMPSSRTLVGASIILVAALLEISRSRKNDV